MNDLRGPRAERLEGRPVEAGPHGTALIFAARRLPRKRGERTTARKTAWDLAARWLGTIIAAGKIARPARAQQAARLRRAVWLFDLFISKEYDGE